MKKILILISILLLANCKKDTKYTNGTKNNIINIMEKTNGKLIDGITIDNSFFNREDIALKKYNYNGTFIEDLKINDLLDSTYRKKFFTYLGSRENENDFKTTFFIRLIMLRIKQLKDTNAFFLLLESSKSESVSSDGIELLNDYLVEIFLNEVTFFVQQSNKYKDASLINYIVDLLNDFLIKENFFHENFGSVNLKAGMLLLDPKKEEEFSNEDLISKLKRYPKIEAIFSPSLYTEWKNETLYFKDIKELFNEDLNDSEKDFYKKNVSSKLTNFYIKNYHVQDKDGFVNLREAPNNTSLIKAKITNGTYVCFLEEKGDWVLVEILGIGEGYIHKSRLKSES